MTSEESSSSPKTGTPQESIVAALVQNPEGEEWASGRIGWNAESEAQVCTWDGVECDPIDDTVTSISMSGEGLKATIPPELGLLGSLTEIDLKENELYGTIPSEVASLPALEVFDVSNNDLTGSFPPFASSVLHSLSLGHNRLSGPLPPTLPETSLNLVKFDASHNGLTGTLPHSIASLQFLRFLDLSSNEIGGSIPPNIGELKELQGLFLNDNELAGTVPPGLARDDLKIVQLFLEHNRLSGTVPAALADLPRLVDLFIDGNKFTGTVPRDLCNLDLNGEFFVGEYNVSGRDGCTSIACPVNTVSREGVHPCSECGGQGFNPYLGHNGRCYHISEKMILDIFYDRTDGPMWDGGAGWGITDVPLCDYDGVTCNNAGHVVNITLPRMNLRGQIPDELGYLRHLRHLDLSDNHLTGYLPSDLRWAPLEHLDVGGNLLKGFVPPMLCLTGDINDNGANGDYNCDNIACEPGTFSKIGRATAKGTVDAETMQTYWCQPCPMGAPHVGSKTCAVSGNSIGTAARTFLARPVTTTVAGVVLSALLASILVPALALMSFRRWRASHYDSDDSYSYDDDEYSHGDYGDGYDSHGEREALEASAAMPPSSSNAGPPPPPLDPPPPPTYGPRGGDDMSQCSSRSNRSGGGGGGGSVAEASHATGASAQPSSLPTSLVAATMAAAARGSDEGDDREERSMSNAKEDLWLDVPKIT